MSAAVPKLTELVCRDVSAIYMASKIAVGTLMCAQCGDGAIRTPAVRKLAKLLRLADYLTSAAEWKLTDLYLGVSQQAIEGRCGHACAGATG
ncbi:uncharacterized protein TRAVEDRAFT_42843 [Trametes versicolor FP-101664 SS1]|uniref:uncharacterized protein n=1 Tax=Trametes versicolor (strain FP-101664) TaxID=717944 RepID=UPI0004623C62|nr:uncharacterized protein TRAVEDRAFT_42843 [Trametes versicolor FP-101664 SS1]EIW62483.1 hypothetical protein TRAVEDRAFT_42843 [Trametes versicolor FP-101664 SS1]